MRFMPHTDRDIEQMLAVIGCSNLDDLVAHVPPELRRKASLNLSPGLSEAQVAAELNKLSEMNRAAHGFLSFLGAGYYRHYVPAVVRAITARAEFATSYTPYQAEASQGTLQAMFEFQTLVTQLTGLEVANASMYDGASAAAEAVLMARRLMPTRSIVALSRALWPDYRDAIRTYLSALQGVEILEVPFDLQSGTIDLAQLKSLATKDLLCVVSGYPNIFGIIEPLEKISDIAHLCGALSISATAESLSLGLLKSPGEAGVDISVGEGQSFGLPLQFGGPGVGFLACRTPHLRQMPGRLVGETVDSDGRRGFCLTLATREQHIRRERATSNICTNHSLCALGATAYLSLLGREGLRHLAERNVELAHFAADELSSAGIRPRFSGPFFNEFTVAFDDVRSTMSRAEAQGVLAGTWLGKDYPELPGGLLVCVTEMNDLEQITNLKRSLVGQSRAGEVS